MCQYLLQWQWSWKKFVSCCCCRDELKIFAGEVIRFGNHCRDPQWHQLDRVFDRSVPLCSHSLHSLSCSCFLFLSLFPTNLFNGLFGQSLVQKVSKQNAVGFFSLSKCLELVARKRLVMWQARKCNDGIFFSLSVGNCFADWDSPLKIRDNQKSRRMSSCKT